MMSAVFRSRCQQIGIAQNEIARVEEEARLVYVGLTRAKRALFLSCHAQAPFYGKMKEQEPSLAFNILGELVAGYPKPVIARFSDFKTNEYAALLGGAQYEPKEVNPMIGWRGASRYYDPKFEPAFRLECAAIKKVREEWGLKNVIVMIPFCRTVEEGKRVIQTMAKAGLRQGADGLKVYMMVEIPSNVILADEFAKIFDGFSIGSNDLTQLTLGVDRDSSLVAHIYNERNQAVKTLLRQVIRSAKKNKIKVGICGQAPSDYPEMAKFLVEEGIDSLSLNPDTVVKTRKMLEKIK